LSGDTTPKILNSGEVLVVGISKDFLVCRVPEKIKAVVIEEKKEFPWIRASYACVFKTI
jgi:hypothetical protein